MAFVIGRFKLGNSWRSPSEILNLIVGHLHRYPLMEAKDVYLLLFQGTMGPVRMDYGGLDFETRLFEEFTLAKADESIPLWENLRPDGEIVRFNLAPYKGRGGDPGTLSTLCLWTLSSFKGNLDDLKESWKAFTRLCQDGRLSKFKPDEVTRLDEYLNKHNFPAQNHSDAYRAAYHPAYRLLRREFLNLAGPSK